ncbi:SET and MYND domain-containing protein 4 [Chlorella vulgaris]
MQSPLQHLLTEISGRVNPSECTTIATAAAEAARHCLEVPSFADVAAVLLATNVQVCAADEEHVLSCKQRGTAAFGRAQYKQAAQLFSEATRYCDELSSTDYGAVLAARLYCNRALCLTKMQPPRLQEALQDSSAAIACDPTFPKAWYRRACAARALGTVAGPVVLQDARRALQLLQQAAQDTSAAAALAAGQQLAVAESEEAGRGLVAAASLAAGQDVAQDQPFAHALTKEGRRQVCATCMARLADVAAPFYCRHCPMPSYCSAACRAADPYHQPGGAECGRPWAALLPAEALAALRLARRMAALGERHPAAQQVAALGTHFQELDPSDAAQLAALAAVTHATWQRAVLESAAARAAAGQLPGGGAAHAGSAAGEEAGEEAEEALLSCVTVEAVLSALCRFQINGLAVVPSQRRGSEDRLALALYPVASLMNHSCLPNVAVRFEGSKLIVRTVEAVPAGQPLLHCYGPQAGEMTTPQRQRLLRAQYYFTCRCRACSPAPVQLESPAAAGLKCPSFGGSDGSAGRCAGAVQPPCSVAAGVLHRYQLSAGTGACTACGARLVMDRWQEQQLPELQAAAEAQAAAVAALAQQDRQQQQAGPAAGAAVQQAIRTLRQCLRQRQQHLHPHNLLLGSTHDALAHAWHLAGNHEAAAQHLRHSLAILAHSYPPASTAVAFQQRQLAETLRLAAAAASAATAAAAEAFLCEARQADEAAEAVLQLHFGPEARDR